MANAGLAVLPLAALVLLSASPARAEGPIILALGDNPAGRPCIVDTNCADNRCRRYPNGERYCVAPDRACAQPGSPGAEPGKTVTFNATCYACVAGLGWRSCNEKPSGPTTGRQGPVNAR